jgi:hypothetical protein
MLRIHGNRQGRLGTGVRSGVLAGLLTAAVVAPVFQLHPQSGGATVPVVRSATPRLAGAAAWRLAPSPSFDVGGGDPDGPDDYSGVSRVIELPNGRVVFEHGATAQVRIHDPSGAMVAKAGRRGDGPGEFRAPKLFPGRGDTILVYDQIPRRLTVIDGNGRIVRMDRAILPVRVPSIGYAGGMFLEPVGTLANGTFILTSWPMMSKGPPSSHYRDSLLVLGARLGDSTLFSIARTGHFEMFQHPDRSQGTWLIFRKHTVVAAGTDRIYVARNEQWEIEEYSLTGRLLRRIQRPVQLTPITPAFIASLPSNRPEQWDRWTEQRRANWSRDVRDRVYAKSFPPISNLFVSPDGLLYVLESDDPRAPKTLAVFDREGTFLTQFLIPEGLRVLAVGRSRVYGQIEDEDGIPHLLGYDILRR